MLDERDHTTTQDTSVVEASQATPERIPLTQMATWASGTFVGVTAISLLSHAGATGIVIAGIAALVASRHGQQALEGVHDHIAFPHIIDSKLAEQKHKKRTGRTPFQRAFGIHPEQSQEKQEAIAADSITPLQEDVPEKEETIFVPSTRIVDVPGIERITVEQSVQHTLRNSFEVYIGRSLTRPSNPAVKINFYKRHLKLIGASQHGKSSMAAALLEVITGTHDPRWVQVALLDLEDKTSRLLADIPHIARVKKHGEMIRLHARGYEQVLAHLGYISALIDLRYMMQPDELERQPVLIVYLEEFVDLKDYFKAQMNGAERDEKDQARQNYERLVYTIKKIAARGLKVLVQLLMCAQVDYRDDDLQAALVNVTSGMSFCVRPSAAQAAGFYQSELLARNAKDDKIGQAVVEMPDCKDLILAPSYDLGAKLKALQGFHAPLQYDDVLDVATEEMTPHREYAMPPLPQKEVEEEQRPILSPKLQMALTLYQSGKVTINDLAAAMTAQGKYGTVSASEAYNLLGLLDEMGYIVRNRKVKTEA